MFTGINSRTVETGFPAQSGSCSGLKLAYPHRAIAMMELLIALLVFSIGMLGLLSAQIGGKRVGYDALQRSVATSLARDILARIQANPTHVSEYDLDLAEREGVRLPEPSGNCDRKACSAEQLVAFDLWQWESQLFGDAERLAGVNAGGLVSPGACILSDGGVVAVEISWLGLSPSHQAVPSSCSEDDGHVEAGGDGEDGEAAGVGVEVGVEGEAYYGDRQILKIITFVAGGS